MTTTMTPEIAYALAQPGVLEKVVPPGQQASVAEMASQVLLDAAYGNLLASLTSTREYLAR